MSGQIIAIEGLDGAGKSSQLELLTQHFRNLNQAVKYLHFPRLGIDFFGQLVAKFLQGKFGNLEQVHPQLVALLFAEDRNANKDLILGWLEEGQTVLLDRYVYSNMAYQCAKLDDLDAKLELIQWIYELEYEIFKIPKPDVSFFLDVPFSFTKNILIQNRTGDDRNYLQGNLDIHEENLHFQEKVKAEYDRILNIYTDIEKIDCINAIGEMKTKQEINFDIISRLPKH